MNQSFKERACKETPAAGSSGPGHYLAWLTAVPVGCWAPVGLVGLVFILLDLSTVSTTFFTQSAFGSAQTLRPRLVMNLRCEEKADDEVSHVPEPGPEFPSDSSKSSCRNSWMEQAFGPPRPQMQSFLLQPVLTQRRNSSRRHHNPGRAPFSAEPLLGPRHHLVQ